MYVVAIIGAGIVGSAIARKLGIPVEEVLGRGKKASTLPLRADIKLIRKYSK